MGPGDLIRVNYGNIRTSNEYQGLVGLVIEHLEGPWWAILIMGKRIHFYDRDLEAVNGAR